MNIDFNFQSMIKLSGWLGAIDSDETNIFA